MLTPNSPPGGANSRNEKRAKANGEGRFQFNSLPAGRYLVGVLAPGYVTPREYEWGPPGKTVTLSDGEVMENFEIEAQPGAVITGRVTDRAGNPVVEAGIRLMKFDGQGKPQSYWHQLGPMGASTDDRGVYRVFGLPAGKYLVSISPLRGPISVKSGEKAGGITVTVAGGAAELSGAVTDAGARGAFRLRVHLIPADAAEADNPFRYYEIISEEGGAFRFKNIAPGRYRLLARPVNADELHVSAERPMGWDSNERARLRREAAAGKNEVELAPCERKKDVIVQ